jgi:hypothetical protein
MKPDDVLRELGQIARDERVDGERDPRWQRLASGELSAEEDAALRRAAEADPELAELYEAYRPLGADVKATIAARVTPLVARADVARTGVVRRGPWRVAALVAIPLAAAAAVAIWLSTSRRDDAKVAVVESPAPDYALTVTGGDRVLRGSSALSPDAPAELRADSRLEIVLRPSGAVTSPPIVRAFLVQNGESRAWDPPMQRSADGAARVAGAAGDLLGGGAGTFDLVFAIGRADDVPADPKTIARALEDRGASRRWQLLVARVRLVASP